MQITSSSKLDKVLEKIGTESDLKKALRAYVREHNGSGDLTRTIKHLTINEALVLTRGNQSEAARKLGINRGCLRTNMKIGG
ncbi:helix-turn-helix domain-containing protein [Pseudoalteromonas luteoviolacea]|uniref:helix-turn-helix domain-containing protein n=1 Tax=Pseudoalteromonas luteoviolacea TaxID=43657 RepID=UPI001B392C67|nr:helix-turn-helix domain-containing protein [Pseudoalteromonas luteoviolacea]MBQ4838806.1 hypothetical protein [Pseudoalteromonas luteoviolacea]